MSKFRLLAGLLAATFVGSTSAATTAPVAGYYVVVPLKARAVRADVIGVSLSDYTLPTGLVGIPYDGFDFKSVLMVTGDPQYTGSGYGVKWSVASGSLPAGLTLTSDGRVVGTPTTNGTTSFQIRATYNTKSGQDVYQIIIGRIVVNLAHGNPPQAIVGQAYTYDLKPLLSVTGDKAYNGSGVTWSVVSSTLPAGLALRADGTIAGTPTAGGTGSVTARASYRNAQGQQTYDVVTLDINVAIDQATPPQGIVGQTYSYDLKPLLHVTGDNAYSGSGVTWSTVSSTLPAGLSLGADGTITGTPTAAGTGNITARATYRNVNGQQMYQVVTLNINVALASATPPQAIVGQAYNYDLKPLLTVNGDSGYNGSGVTWSTVSSTLPAGLHLNADGTLGGTPTASGTGTVTAKATYRGNSGQQTYQIVTLNIVVSLAAGSPPQGIAGQAYSYDLKPLLSVSGDNAYDGSGVTWSVVSSSLPAGLQLLNGGTIGGTPTVAGTGTVTARATYRGVNGQQTYQVVTIAITVSLAAATPPQARVGETYSYDLKPLLTVGGDSSYTGAGVTWNALSNTLPSGLSMSSSGIIAGTPTANTTGSLTAQATYRNVSGQQSYSITALPAWTYSWSAGSWTVPSACGSTTETRSVTCLRTDGTTVADSYCPTASKLSTSATTTDYSSCTYSWNSSSWNVTAACGSTSESRTVTCLRSDGTTVADGSCTGTKPATTGSTTDYSTCTYGWQSGAWSVTPACGSTSESRTNTCLRSDGTTVANSYCTSAQPAATATTTDYSTCTYGWQSGAWSVTPACGSTSESRSVWCQRSDGTTVADGSCSGAKPATSASTTDYSTCTYGWQTGSWSVTAACGSTGETRSVWCQRSDGTTVADGSCTGAKPAASASTTDYSTCTYGWQSGAWSVTPACGSTSESRTNTCLRSDGTTVANSYCTSAQPAATATTTDYSTCTYGWQTGAWSVPSACGSTTETRSVWCQRSDGTTVSGGYCPGAAPAASASTTDYSACTYSWSTSGWSVPSGCGSVTETRSATCYRSDGTAVAGSYCGTAPSTSATTTDYSSCTYSWSTSGWSVPSGCGTVTETRSATCYRSDGTAVSGSYCGTAPATTATTTNYNSCSYSWSYGGWSTPSGCGSVTATRSAACVRSDGTTVSNSYCGTPTTTMSTTDYSSCSYSWSYGAWYTPSGCGTVTATRSASCVRSDGTTVSNGYCGTPTTSMTSSDYSACSYSWSYGGWGSCSASCGGGTQTRSATCVRSDGSAVSNSYCGTPVTSQSCNTQACAPPANVCTNIGGNWTWSQTGGCYSNSTCTTPKKCM